MPQEKSIQIEGGVPLVGEVTVGGSRSLALKLIYASILSGEECVLDNIPRSRYVLDDLEITQELGVRAVWTGSTKLLIDAKDLTGFQIPADKGSKTATAGFLIPALIHKFGKAILPKSVNSILKRDRGGQYAKIWESLGVEVKEDFDNYYLEAAKLQSGEIVLPYKSRVLTDLAILSSMFVLGESTILNASSDIETDDLIDFCNQTGAEVKRLEGDIISVSGCGVYKGVSYSCAYDREEAAFFILSALLTNGNMTLKNMERSRILPLLNWLSKVGVNYEFSDTFMRVWHNSGDIFERAEVNVSPHPGFITDFQPLAVLLSCFSQGESLILENLLATNIGYIKDLNRLGADIEIEKTADNLEIKVRGPVKLKAGRITISDLRYALVSLLFALAVEGQNELVGFEIIQGGFDNMVENITSLGGRIFEQS